MSDAVYIVRELDHEWWEPRGAFGSLGDAIAAGYALDRAEHIHTWDVLRQPLGTADGEVVFDPPPRQDVWRPHPAGPWYISCASVGALRPEDLA